VLILLGTLLAVSGGVVWVLGGASWADLDSRDPGKVLAADVFATLKTQVSSPSQNGRGLRGMAGRIFGWQNRPPDSTPAEK
jgi:hypothetical protein